MNYLATPKARRDPHESGAGVAFPSSGWLAVVIAAVVVGAAVASYRATAPAIAGEPASRARFVPVRATGGGAATLRHAAIAARHALDGVPAQAESGAAPLSALRDWAQAEPEAAVARARDSGGELRVAAIVAALEGASARPALALALVRQLMRDDPAHAADFGTALVGAFVRAADFGPALDLARTGPVEQRSAWLATIFAAWADREPGFARDIASALGGQGIDDGTFKAVMENWSAVAPAQAAAYALSLPSGPARQTACVVTFSRWAAQDPAALAAVLPGIADPAERDAAATAFVCGTDAANRSTADAFGWAEAIADQALRQRALAHVLQELAQQDASAAVRYIENAPRLSPADRDDLLAAISPRPSSPDA